MSPSEGVHRSLPYLGLFRDRTLWPGGRDHRRINDPLIAGGKTKSVVFCLAKRISHLVGDLWIVVCALRAHGIRKQVAQKLAEAGGSNAELKALFGWNSDAMAALYTKGADKRRLAQAAANKLTLGRDYGEGEG